MAYATEDFKGQDDGFYTFTVYSSEVDGPYDSLDEAIEETERYYRMMRGDAEEQVILQVEDGKVVKAWEDAGSDWKELDIHA